MVTDETITQENGARCLDMTHATDVIRDMGDVAPTLQQRMGTGGNQVPLTYDTDKSKVSYKCIVRRLTPMETERLQGLPDAWTNIGPWTDSKGKYHKESSDSARYRAIGNSIALPPWKWVLKRICANYERDATMGSLFSGLGGFDLIWTQLNGKDSVRWESEVEEFAIAITKRHFGDEDTGEQGDLGLILYGKGECTDA